MADTRDRSDDNLTVLVVDDHDVVHWGFRLLLERQPWVAECLAARSGEAAVEIAHRTQPDVALVDLMLGDESGAEVCEEIIAASPGTYVLLISGGGTISPSVAKAAGASGFITKDWGAADVIKAVRMVALGSQVFAESTNGESPILTEREQQVLELISAGSTNREIAEHLHLSPHTIKEHTSAIYRKLQVRNRAEAVRQAQRLRLIS